MTETACEYEAETLSISCPTEEVIYVINSFYGRTTLSICPNELTQHPNLNCVSEVAPAFIREKCDRKNSCEIFATTFMLGDPCPGTTKYVQVTYECMCKYWHKCVTAMSRGVYVV